MSFVNVLARVPGCCRRYAAYQICAILSHGLPRKFAHGYMLPSLRDSRPLRNRAAASFDPLPAAVSQIVRHSLTYYPVHPYSSCTGDLLNPLAVKLKAWYRLHNDGTDTGAGPTGRDNTAQGNALGIRVICAPRARNGRYRFCGRIVAPFQGFVTRYSPCPRALPWAVLFEPFRLYASDEFPDSLNSSAGGAYPVHDE